MIRHLKSLLGDRRGNVAMMFGLAIVPLMGLIGAGIDYSRSADAYSRLQAAVDSATVALAKLPYTTTQATLDTQANTIIKGFIKDTAIRSSINITVTRTTGKLVVNAAGQVVTPIASLVGIANAPLSVSSAASWGDLRLRVSLVLDVTGSMNDDNKLSAMKTAATNLLTQLQGAAAQDGDVYVSIVPFAKDVNFGASNYAQSSINWSGAYDTWDENNGSCSDGSTAAAATAQYTTSRKAACVARASCSNTTYSSQSSCTSSGACSRAGYNTQSSCTATGACSYSSYTDQNSCQSNGKCVYGGTAYQPYSTSYTAQCQSYGGTWSTYTWAPSTWTANTWNAATWTPANHSTWNGCMMDRDQSYDTTNTTPGSASATKFPAEQYAYCPAQLMALSYNWTSLKAKVSSLVASGGTNQQVGLAWGFQTLTASPFSIPAKDPNYQYNEVIILLSDGLNTQNRVYGNGTTYTSQVDTRQAILCNNVKASNISLYTVQVNTGGDATSTVLQNCASSTDKFFMLTSADQIVTTFGLIGTALSNLRLSH